MTSRVPLQFLDLDSLKSSLMESVPSRDPAFESMAEAFSQARLLAESAYVEKNREAESQAERILYLIHTMNHFAPPVQAQPALIWGVLGRAKLWDALQVQQSIAPVTRETLREELQELVKTAEKNDHPILDAICGYHDLKGVRIYAKNWMVTAHGFINQLGALFQRAPAKLKPVVRENIDEEFEGTEHTVLRERFLKAIGVQYSPDAALRDPDYLFESMSVLNYRTLICSLSNPFFAFGNFYSIEGVFYQVSRHLAQGLRKRGMAEADIEMFTLHGDLDEDHAAEWLAGLEAADLTDLERGQVLAGARAQMKIRHRHYEAMTSLLIAR